MGCLDLNTALFGTDVMTAVRSRLTLDGCRDRLSCSTSLAGGVGWEVGVGTGRHDHGRAAVSGCAGGAGGPAGDRGRREGRGIPADPACVVGQVSPSAGPRPGGPSPSTSPTPP